MRKKLSFLLALVLLSQLFAGSVFAIEPPTIDAKAAILAEAKSGETLFEQNADEHLFPASTTKLMTALVALEYGNPDDIITVSPEATKGLPEMGSSVYLIPGEQMSFNDMLRYLLIASGNDASNALAEHVSGSVDVFVELMNNRARDLGCTNTHFMNAHGLHDENHYTSARDLLLIAKKAMENPTIAEIVMETSVTLPVTNKHPATTTINSTNHLISSKRVSGYLYPGAIGIKTGTTTPAGLCLISGFKKDDLTYFTVILGAKKYDDGKLGNFSETIKLFDYAANGFQMQNMLNSSEPICEVPVKLSKNQDSVVLMPESSITALLPVEFKTTDLQLDYTAEKTVSAPVEKGQVLGSLKVSYNGKEYGNMNLVASTKVEVSKTLYYIDKITSFFTSTAFKIIIGVIIALVMLLVAYVILVNRRRKKHKKYSGSRRRK